ncbi:glycosyltransferase family 2 protein [uncultured Xylophilus sp.]|uniref:glycosyltransferase family 2 protein n=1 Tax=uncultured Xylophilus sp. TaxID=296832 RepID=UPI0025FCF04A|nr:glycosyltransferase family 2 protein [uncultured Xylophilus sp.]
MAQSEPTPAIDIAIVNYRGADDVAVALQALGAWTRGTVWLVDNSEDAAQAAALQAIAAGQPDARVLAAPGNLGFGRGCNLAFAQSTAPFFLLLNPDARMAQADLLTLARALQDDPALGGVSPAIYWNDARSFVMPPAEPQTPRASLAQPLLTRSRPRARRQAERQIAETQRRMAGGRPFAVDFVAGAVLLLRRSAVEAAGGLFDPDYFMFFEDADLSLRLCAAGHGLAMVPAAAAVHEYRHKPFKAGLMDTAQQIYFRKHFPRFLRWTGRLRWLGLLAKPLTLVRWFDAVLPADGGLAGFAARTEGLEIVAVSPSPLLWPAMCRPAGQARGFDADEWALLEPGWYAALVRDRRYGDVPRWLYFER